MVFKSECKKVKAWMYFDEIIACLRVNDPIPAYCRKAIEHMSNCDVCTYYFNVLKNNPEIIGDEWAKLVNEALDA